VGSGVYPPLSTQHKKHDIMNTEVYYSRIRSIFRPESLRQKRLIIAGMGSGGSRVAHELGRLGVTLLLIDRPGELLEEHNIVRHALSYRSLGKPKATEMAKHIRSYNKKTKVAVAEIDIVADKARFTEVASAFRPDVIMTCVDNEEAKHVVDEFAVEAGIPTAGGAVFDGGVGGEVFITRPKQACYGCIAHHLKLSHQTTQNTVNIDYTTGRREARSTCALNIDIDQLALIHARIGLSMLLGSETDLTGIPNEVNLVVFANRPMPGSIARPLHAEFYSIPQNPRCFVCGSHAHTEKTADDILSELARATKVSANQTT